MSPFPVYWADLEDDPEGFSNGTTGPRSGFWDRMGVADHDLRALRNNPTAWPHDFSVQDLARLERILSILDELLS